MGGRDCERRAVSRPDQLCSALLALLCSALPYSTLLGTLPCPALPCCALLLAAGT